MEVSIRVKASRDNVVNLCRENMRTMRHEAAFPRLKSDGIQLLKVISQSDEDARL